MTEPLPTIHGLSLEQWQAAYRPGMAEFAATSFAFSREAPDLIRIAFGSAGPFINELGARAPVYTHAVTLPPDLAVKLAGLLLKACAEPEASRSTSSAEL